MPETTDDAVLAIIHDCKRTGCLFLNDEFFKQNVNALGHLFLFFPGGGGGLFVSALIHPFSIMRFSQTLLVMSSAFCQSFQTTENIFRIV